MNNTPTPLLRSTLEHALRTPLKENHSSILLWLVWLSLSSIDDLALCLHKPAKTVWNHINNLEHAGYVSHVRIQEPGWSHHHRYYITDLGLYVLAGQHQAPLSLLRLAQFYPVTRLDLLSRLAQSHIHLPLSSFISTLIATCPPGYQITSWQQPWRQRYQSLHRSTKTTFLCDAAFLLRHPSGTQHAFYLALDQSERLFSDETEKRLLSQLIDLQLLQTQEASALPTMLILLSPERYPFWSDLLEKFFAHNNSTIQGALANKTVLKQNLFTPVWYPFHQFPSLLQAERDGKRKSMLSGAQPLHALCTQGASVQLIDTFSRAFSLQHLLLRRKPAPLSQRYPSTLDRYVGDALQEEAQTFCSQQHNKHIQAERTMALRQSYQKRIHLAALLTLNLHAEHKSILHLLLRHPYLTTEDLKVLVAPERHDIRAILRPLEYLIDLGLVQRSLWHQAPSKSAYHRYQLTETAIRYFSIRHHVPPTDYLSLVPDRDTTRQHKQWLQRGSALLQQQIAHTNGLYQSIHHILRIAHSKQEYTILYWKNARECLRWHRDSITGNITFPRPDAELLYLLPGDSIPHSVLLEYDHGTTFFREYASKFEDYVEHQEATGIHLPPILIILHRIQNKKAIQEAIHAVGGTKLLHIVFVTTDEAFKYGLMPLLERIE